MAAKGFSAAPVIDEAGRPVGVLSYTDVLVHQGESTSAKAEKPPVRVADVMTPAVFSVTTTTPAAKVVEELVGLNVHQVYVMDEKHTVIGVVTALDVLKRLRAV